MLQWNLEVGANVLSHGHPKRYVPTLCEIGKAKKILTINVTVDFWLLELGMQNSVMSVEGEKNYELFYADP
jgi:hypothetical protein